MPWGSRGGTLPGPAQGGYPGRGGTLAGGYPGRGVPWLGGTLAGGYPGLGEGGTLAGGYPGRGGVPWLGGGGYPARGGTLPGGRGTQLGQHREYLLHGGRYASCVHAGGLSCFYCFWITVVTKRRFIIIKNYKDLKPFNIVRQVCKHIPSVPNANVWRWLFKRSLYPKLSA